MILKPYELLENVLKKIEENIMENINADDLAKEFSLSSVHLQRLFKFAFNRSIGNYIRSRKLTVSIDALLKSNYSILDIALEYGFEYEKSYIRAFKQEFGITPGRLRKTAHITKITPPIHLFDARETENGVFFGPEIVMVPQFHIIGRRYQVPGCDIAALTPKLAMQFMDEVFNKTINIKAMINSYVYIGLARNYNFGEGVTDYMPSVLVKNINDIPQGLYADTFDTSLCARFRYIGKHHYFELTREIAQPMYDAIWNFRHNKQAKYTITNDLVYFEKVDSRDYDGTYCKLEWFSPVIERLKNELGCIGG